MRIMQFTDTFIPIMDGVGNVAYQYARYMGLKGHEVYAVTPQADTGYRGRYPFEIVDYIGVPLLRMKSYKVGMPVLDLHCQNRLNMIRADIAHVHSPFIAGQAGVNYAQKQGIPLVGTFHSKYYDDFLQITGSKHMAELGTDIIVNFYNHCDEVWAVSENSADTLRSYGYEGPLKVMPNGMDVKQLDPYLSIRAKEYFHIDDDPCLLFVGQMNWKKNIAHILEAASLLKKDLGMNNGK